MTATGRQWRPQQWQQIDSWVCAAPIRTCWTCIKFLTQKTCTSYRNKILKQNWPSTQTVSLSFVCCTFMTKKYIKLWTELPEQLTFITIFFFCFWFSPAACPALSTRLAYIYKKQHNGAMASLQARYQYLPVTQQSMSQCINGKYKIRQ